MRRVLVLGSSNTDLILHAERLPKAGETVLGGAFLQAPGGKGANQAVAAARAGAQVTFLGAVGCDDFGAQANANLAAEGIDVAYLKKVAGPSGVALILVDHHGENLIGVAPGANALFTAEDVANLPEEVFAAPGIFVASLEVPLETVWAGLTRAKEKGWATILNPAPASREVASPQWLRLVDVLVLNETETLLLTSSVDAGALTTLRDAARKSLEERGQELRQAGCQNVVITMGSQGYLLVEESGCAGFAACPVHAVDAVGAGDAFVGVLAAEWAAGVGLRDAAAFANRAAALTVTRPGAQPALPYREEILRFMP